MDKPVTLEMIYDEVKKVNDRLKLMEDMMEEIIVRALREAKVSKKKIEEIERSIREMKEGKYVTLEELKSA